MTVLDIFLLGFCVFLWLMGICVTYILASGEEPMKNSQTIKLIFWFLVIPVGFTGGFLLDKWKVRKTPASS